MDFYKRALELQNETVAHRRYFHQNAETGLDMPLASEYVIKTLSECGIEAHKCGCGIIATIGSRGKTILLRADMDALPTVEESGEPFACKKGNAHTCGHDLHASMLLTAAKMLKECEASVCGRVKLMFQAAEETLEGCQNMIDSGVLEDPDVDAALAFHVTSGKIPLGTLMYNSDGVMMNSADVFRITVKGKGGHGAYPNLTVDPINIAVQIYSALTTLVPKETEPDKSCVISIGKLNGGDTANVIPDTAVLEGSLRTNDEQARAKLVKRIIELASAVAKAYNGEADAAFLTQVPPLICNSEFTNEMVTYMQSLSFGDIKPISGMRAGASEDFAIIAQSVSSAMIYLSAGFMDERGEYPAHNPRVRFNEDVLPIGAAGYAICAYNWLKNNVEKQ